MKDINILPLSEEWIPPHLLCRVNELETLKTSIDSPLPNHWWIDGKNGTGKTVTIRGHLVPFLRLKGHMVFYHNMERGGCENNIKKWTQGFMRKTNDMDNVITKIHELSHDKQKIIFIFDDLQHLINMKRDFSPRLLKIFNQVGQYAQGEGYLHPFQVILVSQIPWKDRMKYLKVDVLDRYQFETLKFGRYDRHEMMGILAQRIKYIYGDNKKKDVCSYLASIVENKMESNLRTAIKILKKIVLEKGDYTRENVDSMIEELEEKAWRDTLLKDFTPHRALDIYLIAR